MSPPDAASHLQGSGRDVPWPLVERLLDVGNQLADALEYEAHPSCDQWDQARYAVRGYAPARTTEEKP